MILPIRALGDPVLRTPAAPIVSDSPDLQRLIDDMLETMRGADGAGLAAPQVGHSLRVFVADLTTAYNALHPEVRPEIPPQPMVCINPEVVEESAERHNFSEGCLSIPGLVEKVSRPVRIKLKYRDRAMRPRAIDGVGYTSSVLLHEFEHLRGVLYIDHLPAVRRRLILGRLRRIERGEVQADYPLQFSSSDATGVVDLKERPPQT